MKRLLTIMAIIATSVASTVPGMAAPGGGSGKITDSATDFAPEVARLRNVQKALTRAGYYHYAIDGFWSLTTENAVEEYEKENDLPVNGTIDETLLRSLGLPD